MTSTLKVNTIKKQSGSSITIGESGTTVDIPAGATLDTTGATVTGITGDGKLLISAQDTTRNYLQSKIVAGTNITITLNNAGGNETITFASSAAEVKPTIGSINPSVITNAQTNVTITGTNFVSVPIVEAINSTGSITSADSVTFTSATTLVAAFTLPVDGTYFLRIENNDGNAVRSGTALLTVSDAPAWVTAAGSLGNVASGGTMNFTVSATNATAYAVTSGSMPGGASLNSSTGAITGTESGSTGTTTYNFTITATDAEGQTAARAFSISVSHGIQNAMRFS
jgi:hypothetical protein